MRVRVTRDTGLVYARPGGIELRADLARPAEPAQPLPVIIVVHGGGWCAGDRTQKAAEAMRLARAGFLTVSIDYRLAPAHPYPAALDDLRAAAAWVRAHSADYGGDPDRLGAYGVSSGAHLVALLATDPATPLRGAVGWGGPMDLRADAVTPPYRGYLLAFMAACTHDAPARYAEASPITRLSPAIPPLLLLHGTADCVVPYQQSLAMVHAAEMSGAPVELYRIEGAGHEPGDPRAPRMVEAWERVIEFFCRYLTPTGEAMSAANNMTS